MRNIVDCLNESIEDEVFVVRDKDDNTIITICDTEEQAKKAIDFGIKGNSYEIVKDKKSNYIK